MVKSHLRRRRWRPWNNLSSIVWVAMIIAWAIDAVPDHYEVLVR
jgi:hypothetical protein